MPRAFTTLMVEQMAQMLSLSAVPHRRTEHSVWRLQVDDDEPARTPDHGSRLLQQELPVHGQGLSPRGQELQLTSLGWLDEKGAPIRYATMYVNFLDVPKPSGR